MVRRTVLVVLMAFFGLLLPLSAASADVGPKPTLTLRILREGVPVSDPQMRVRLFACTDPGNRWSGQGEPIPGLERFDLSDPSGCVWREAGPGVYGGACSDGECSFSGFLPERFRVAAYLPGEGRTYLTDAAERRAMHERYAVTLAADGTGALRSNPLPIIGRNWSLGGMVVALALTLAVELLVIAGYTRLAHIAARRLLIVGLIANGLSLPCVWLLSGMGYVMAGVEAGLTALVVAEGLAWLVETVIYIVAGRLSLGRALVLSLAANAASVIVGMVVH